MPLIRLCPRCARPNGKGNARGLCDACGVADSRHRNQRGYADPQYRALRHHAIATHIRAWGVTCPGIQPTLLDAGHPPHPVQHEHDLTIDHIVPLTRGGSLLDQTNWRVLCRSENSRRAGHPTGAGGLAQNTRRQ